MPLFSVIIPTYNRAALLRRTLDSVFAQEFTDYEIIVVDDGSTDDTQVIIDSAGPRVALLRQENKGPGAARNLGIQHAIGDYIAFLDSDDLWFPWTLTAFSKLISEYEQPAILSAKLLQFSDEASLGGVRYTDLRAIEYSDYYSSDASYFVGAGMAVLKRGELVSSGGFTELRINCEDHDLILRLGAQRGFVQVLEPVTLAWRRHANSATSSVESTFRGVRYLMEQEQHGKYPGGPEREGQRRRILTRHIRPVSLDCLRHGLRREAWKLYWETIGWHVRMARWKYLFGFPLKAALSVK